MEVRNNRDFLKTTRGVKEFVKYYYSVCDEI